MGGINVLGAIVPWNCPVTVQGDANLSFLRGLELLAVDLHGMSMGEDDGVADAIQEQISATRSNRDMEVRKELQARDQ